MRGDVVRQRGQSAADEARRAIGMPAGAPPLDQVGMTQPQGESVPVARPDCSYVTSEGGQAEYTWSALLGGFGRQPVGRPQQFAEPARLVIQHEDDASAEAAAGLGDASARQ